jgi:hypothetical protein
MSVFSPRDFKAWVIEEATTGTAPTLTSGLYQLDVDSVAFPTINVNQVMNVRTQTGRVLHANDFFQDNDMRTVEVSLSGTFHKDGGHVMLMQSVAGNDLTPDSVADVTIASGATAKVGKYGTTEGNKTFTLVLASPDTTDGYNLVLSGCLCTNFVLNADMGTDGGQYKFSATIVTGRVPDFANTVTEAGTAYDANHIDMSGIDVSAVKIGSKTAPVLSSFSLTIDSPAVFTGVDEGNGYACFGRGEEIAVTSSSTVKYDSTTRALISEFDTQSTHDAADAFIIPQTTATKASVTMTSGILTNVALNEGDIMMMDVEHKGVDIGSGNVLLIDLA